MIVNSARCIYIYMGEYSLILVYMCLDICLCNVSTASVSISWAESNQLLTCNYNTLMSNETCAERNRWATFSQQIFGDLCPPCLLRHICRTQAQTAEKQQTHPFSFPRYQISSSPYLACMQMYSSSSWKTETPRLFQVVDHRWLYCIAGLLLGFVCTVLVRLCCGLYRNVWTKLVYLRRNKKTHMNTWQKDL